MPQAQTRTIRKTRGISKGIARAKLTKCTTGTTPGSGTLPAMMTIKHTKPATSPAMVLKFKLIRGKEIGQAFVIRARNSGFEFADGVGMEAFMPTHFFAPEPKC